ncbi:hypothetical protein [Streptomyces sp. R41]|uniref:Uncharacterized protein n=1 Tax=Streptomyces sp. R41 TaxID=3238632 RepID=A0AB39R5P4_9ACTN
MAISALALIASGSSTAVASTDDAANSAHAAAISPTRESSSTDRPQVVQPRKNAKSTVPCDQIRKQAAAQGKATALCVESVPVFQAPKRVARAATGSGVTWCDAQAQGQVYVTRKSICENQVSHVSLIVPETREVLGEAWLNIKQEVNTKNTDVNFSEDFFLRVQAVTGALVSGFNVAIKGECAATSACQQGLGPWTGPAPVTLLSEKEGTWQRNWKNTTGFDTLMLEYTLTASYGAAKASYSWGVSQNAGWQVRCDKELSTAGCVVPKYTPTFEIPSKYNEARQFIGMVQASMSSHPGWEGKGEPLHREANETVARRNRDIVCDDTFRPSSSTPKPVQCDEFPFAGSKESGAQQGVTEGKTCQQYSVVSETREGKEYLSLTWPGLNQGKMPPANAKCARASMPKVQNEGVGGELGRKTKKWRLLMGDAYWVDAGNK